MCVLRGIQYIEYVFWGLSKLSSPVFNEAWIKIQTVNLALVVTSNSYWNSGWERLA